MSRNKHQMLYYYYYYYYYSQRCSSRRAPLLIGLSLERGRRGPMGGSREMPATPASEG